jgi:DNA (cytosine-5)-methyltransferase 1
MRKPRLLDLFCGAGGCSVGYHRAGFLVTGVDIAKQPRYPFRFIQADALEYVAENGHKFDAVHASPPCQRYSTASFTKDNKERHPDLLGPTRSSLQLADRPWVIENVPGSPMEGWPVQLCGLMFGLKVFRHRWFESSLFLMSPHHPSHLGKVIGKGGMCCVVGHGGGCSRRMRQQINRHGAGGQQGKAEWMAAMGIDWMTRNEMAQAIPPAYTQLIGRQLVSHLRAFA